MEQTITGDITGIASVPQNCEWPYQGSLALKLYNPEGHGEVILRSFRKQVIYRVQGVETQRTKDKTTHMGPAIFDNLDSH